ncbi:Sentrin-specific protease 6 [Acipenser ruthenus]|uniref:Sentrin-specific protease 6 n=1 Tax=Acipenser ruthenus TaxID=7906 RepID=A0A662YND3_ACIRT|nr:Sentrin-specific protease 6 [Acipenser ruthenus]
MTVNSLMMDVVMTPPAHTTRSNLVYHNGRAELAGGTSPASSKMSRSRKQPVSKLHELNDPIVLSSDEDEETDNASTGSVSRMDSVSPRPADSAHSSPAPSGGRVEAAVKDNTEQAEEASSDIFTEIDLRIPIPRKARMKDQFGNNVPDNIMSKRRKVVQIHPGGLHTKLESIILDCRSIRIGSLRRMVTKPVIQAPDSSVQPRTIATRLQTSAHQFFEDDEEMADMNTVFTGPVQKLIVYPPAPAKGGISVTNEDLHCLNEGEFLNDVIIDFYLKYLVLEKLKKEDAQRSHVFSSFFYKRLNQRERRNVQDTANLTIQQRKHKRVKTWTRHVDLFQKDFIFVPINESYLEVEWEARKGSKRSFPKELMRGSSPRVPQQDNFSDCGVYILQYVESFFENSIPSFDLPMNLTDWFPEHRMKKKREEIKELILKLHEQQQTDRMGQTDPGTEALSELVPENTSASCSD